MPRFKHPESQLPLFCDDLCLKCWVKRKIRDQHLDPQNRDQVHELAQNKPKYVDALQRTLAGQTVKPHNDTLSFLSHVLCKTQADYERLDAIIRHNRRTAKDHVLTTCWFN